MTEEKGEKLLQWIKGDNAGTVETVIEETSEWIKFQSGRRINTSLITEFMIDASKGALDPTDLSLAVTAAPPQTPVRPKPNGNVSENPIETLIKKSSKVYSDQISVSFNFTIPSTELVSFISDSFGEEETINCIKKYLTDQVSIDNLKDAIQDSIDDFIKQSYR
jgi:hypothetical protein